MTDEKALWYVVHTYSGYENKVANDLVKTVENNGMGDLIQDVTVPIEEIVEIRNGKPHTIQHKLFPGYVLVKMIKTTETWYIELLQLQIQSAAGNSVQGSAAG